MAIYQHTTGFTRGEVDESLWDRVDVDFYATAAKVVDNWFPNVAGGLERRPAVDDVIVSELLPQTTSEVNMTQHILIFKKYILHVRFSYFYNESGVRHDIQIFVRLFDKQNGPLEDMSSADPVTIENVADIGDDPISLYICTVSVGPAMFITSPLFSPRRAFIDGLPEAPQPNIEEIIWFEELLGTVAIDKDTSTWTGTDTLFADQLAAGDKFHFQDQEFTVDVITDQESMTSVETYTGVSLAGERINIVNSDPFGGNPRLCTFYNSRLFLFSTESASTKMWASKTSNPFIIIPGTVYDDAPINYELFSEGVDEFVWVATGENIFLGSSRAEFMIASSGEGPITPTNFGFTRISSLGGSSIQPVTSDAAIIFVSRDRTRIFAVAYDFQRSGFVTSDLSLLAAHLFADRVRELHFRPAVKGDNTSRLFVTLDSDKFITAALSEDQNVVSWARYTFAETFVPYSLVSTSDGVFILLGDKAGPTPDGNSSWLMFCWQTFGQEDAFSMDFAREYTPGDEKKVDNIALFLTNRPVAVISAVKGFLGLYEPTVMAGGEAGELDLSNIEGDLGNVIIGVPFASKLVMLPTVFNTGRGLSINRKIRMIRVLVSLRNAYQLFINNQPLFGNIGARLGRELPRKDGVFEKRMLGWYSKDEVTIESASIYPATILSVTREVNL
jgi:hypothetical protein